MGNMCTAEYKYRCEKDGKPIGPCNIVMMIGMCMYMQIPNYEDCPCGSCEDGRISRAKADTWWFRTWHKFTDRILGTDTYKTIFERPRCPKDAEGFDVDQ